MGDIINLRRVRKERDRKAKAAEADANRRRHGLGRAEREAAEQAREAATRKLDGARIERE